MYVFKYMLLLLLFDNLYLREMYAVNIKGIRMKFLQHLPFLRAVCISLGHIFDENRLL